jgi:hypothetical protein
MLRRKGVPVAGWVRHPPKRQHEVVSLLGKVMVLLADRPFRLLGGVEGDRYLASGRGRGRSRCHPANSRRDARSLTGLCIVSVCLPKALIVTRRESVDSLANIKIGGGGT